MAGKNRQKAMAEKKKRKAIAMRTPGFKSRYARKREYCYAAGVNASDVPEPKPWK